MEPAGESRAILVVADSATDTASDIAAASSVGVGHLILDNELDAELDPEVAEASGLLRYPTPGVSDSVRMMGGAAPFPTSESLELNASTPAPPLQSSPNTNHRNESRDDRVPSMAKPEDRDSRQNQGPNAQNRNVTAVNSSSDQVGLLGSIRFCLRESPGMSRSEQVRFLRRFHFGDTYKLKSRSWLLPQFLSGVLILIGVVLTLVGIISLQINKYLHACDEEDGRDCTRNQAAINNVMMPIGVGSTGGGLSLILISGFVFLHAFCVVYEDVDGEDDGTHDGVLHIPVSARAALLDPKLVPTEESIARCHSYYDNLQQFASVPVENANA